METLNEPESSTAAIITLAHLVTKELLQKAYGLDSTRFSVGGKGMWLPFTMGPACTEAV